MTETKTLDTLTLASVTTGHALVTEFSKIHEAVTWLMGHEVWTHELPAYLPLAASEALEQYPDLPSKYVGLEETQAEAVERYGETLPVRQGNSQRAKGPEETLREIAGDRPVIVIGGPDAD